MQESSQTTGRKGRGNGKPQVVSENDYVKVGLICVYLTQKLGNPTLDYIQKTALDKLSVKLRKPQMRQALKGASKRGLIAIEKQQVGPGGSQAEVYSMKDVARWRQPPEYAHIIDLYPKLLEDPAGRAIKDWFDKGEAEFDEAQKKTKRGLDIEEYYHFRVLVMTLDDLYGSQIHCPYTDMVREKVGLQTSAAKGTKAKGKEEDEGQVEMEGIFIIDPATGAYVIPADVLKGWAGTNMMRYCGHTESKAEYLAFDPVKIFPTKEVLQIVLPVQGQGGRPAAPKSHECIQPGQVFEISFMAPTKGVLSADQWEKLFHIAGRFPRRGLSPARGRRSGRFVVLKWENLGEVKSKGLDIDFILDTVPDEVLVQMGKKKRVIPTEPTAEHWKYVVEAADRLKNVDLKPGKKTADIPTEPFPTAEANSDCVSE